ncbi:MAG: hypothetical protein NXI00_24045 [Cytophagales bacterium]|nr:hypothetical protein [Cytophagales bacterium]
MKKFVTLLWSAIFVFGLNHFCSSQSKELAKLMDNPDKLRKSVLVQLGELRKIQIKKGWAKEEDYKLPQRVGLLTFVVNDKAKTVTHVSSSVTTTSRTKRTSEALSLYANHLYSKTIDGIKASFTSRGMNLLEIDDYLDTEEKSSIYDSYQLKELKAVKAFDGLTGAGNSGPAQGYRNMTLPYFGAMPKAIKERDAFFESLNLDAVLIVTIEMDSFRDSFWLIQADLLYKNPARTEKRIPYGKYHEAIVSRLRTDPYAKKPLYEGIHVLGEETYHTKKGKSKTRKVINGFDPNFYSIINKVVDFAAERLHTYVEG